MRQPYKFEIAGRKIGPREVPYFVAEMSGNHQHCIEQARALIKCAKKSGADAIKLQTYTADTLTLPIRDENFRVKGPWKANYLYDLYKVSYTPWEWHEDLAEYASKVGIVLFSTPFDEASVEFVERTLKPPVYKISSFELTHLPLLKKVAETKKPVILSTGMATEEEIKEAVETLRTHGCKQLMLLKCVSAYPAEPKDFNLRSITLLEKSFKCLVGLSDHCLSSSVALGAVALGACLIEKHFVLNRQSGAVDEAFSLEPQEFSSMVQQVKDLHLGLGKPYIGPTSQEIEQGQPHFRRSIFVFKDVFKGEILSEKNLKIVRPASGLAPKHWDSILGKKFTRNLKAGSPLRSEDIEDFC